MNCPECGEPDIEIQFDGELPLWGCRNCPAQGTLIPDSQANATRGVGVGTLQAIVWPVMMGAATGDPGPGPAALCEPLTDPDYQRGQITWYQRKDGTIAGRARVYLPKGVYPHILFCAGPHEAGLMGNARLEQPLVIDRPGFIDIDPIRNQDVLPRGAA